MAVTVTLDLFLKPEATEEFVGMLAEMLPDTRAFQGCQGVAVVRNQDDPNQITLIERWDSRADQERYIAWRTETGAMNGAAEASAAPIKMTYFDELQQY